ncbi:MAG: RNA polymerase sigma factor [Pirellulaceae bacterium]
MRKIPKAIFTRWLEEHSSSVLKVARAYTLTKKIARIWLREILLQAWRSLPKFAGKASPGTWFYRVALHTAMNWHRNDQPRRQFQKPLLEVQTLATNSVDSSQQLEQQELLERLYDAIHQLPRTDVALVLLYLDDMTYREMARVLGISESNVGVQLNRAKKVLATLLEAEPAEGEADES